MKTLNTFCQQNCLQKKVKYLQVKRGTRPPCRDHFVAGHLVAGPPCRRPLCRKVVKNFYAPMEGRKMLLGRSGFSGVISFGFTLLKNPAEFTRIREKNKREKTLKNFIKKILKKPWSRFTY